MTFNSVEECISYIENAIRKCMGEISVEIKHIMDDVTREQIRGVTGQIFSSVIGQTEGMSASAGFENVGYWYSLVTGQSVGNPIKFLEAGTTWGRGATNIMDVALGRVEDEIPRTFLQLMRDMGIPIQG